jgi:molybdopterin-guanine dinucleotide biosynthesis protein A
MGQDKTTMLWHGKEQRYHLADMLQPFCEEVYISCRADQQPEIDRAYKTLQDALDISGPLNGILSAMRAYKNVAWLVVASDLPVIDAATLQYLIDNRVATGIATTFRSPHDQLPEPLITIWEPAALAVLEAHLANGFKCPRKALIRNEEIVRLIDAPWPASLLNANTPADAEMVRNMLRK